MYNSTTKLQRDIKRALDNKHKQQHESWWAYRHAYGMQTHTRPRAQEIADFRAWASAGMPTYEIAKLEKRPVRDETPTLYGGTTHTADDTPKARMAKHAHRSQRARDNAASAEAKGGEAASSEQNERDASVREHKGDTYTTEPYKVKEAEAHTLPALLPREEELIRIVHMDPLDAGDRRDVRRHKIACMFARVAAIERGNLNVGSEGDDVRIDIDADEEKAMGEAKGIQLNTRIHRLAMQLHARDDYTDVVACDGSKKEDPTQPWDTTYFVQNRANVVRTLRGTSHARGDRMGGQVS